MENAHLIKAPKFGIIRKRNEWFIAQKISLRKQVLRMRYS